MGFFEFYFWVLVVIGMLRVDYIDDQRWWEPLMWWKIWRD